LQALNAILFPILVFTKSQKDYNSLDSSIFSLFLTANFARPFIRALNPSHILLFLRRRYLRSQLVNNTTTISQERANQIFQAPEVDISVWYTDLLTKFMMTLAFTPLIPIVAPISIAGFVFDYWVKKVTLLRFAARPRLLNERISRRMMQYVKVAIVLYALGMVYFCQELPGNIPNVAFISLGIAVGFFALPVSLFKHCFRRLLVKPKYENQVYDEKSKYFFIVFST
jgi:hypothetical protein